MTTLEMPAGATIEVRERRENYAKFVIEPLERGFGITLGNALRRILLSTIPGAAVTYMKIDGVLHEFSTIHGMVEDTIALMLNLKGLPVKLNSDEPRVLNLSVSGPKNVTAADIAPDADVEILDPSYHIATLTSKEGKLSMEIGVEKGRGYVMADKQRNIEHMIGLIPLDSIFSPIRKVNFLGRRHARRSERSTSIVSRSKSRPTVRSRRMTRSQRRRPIMQEQLDLFVGFTSRERAAARSAAR